MVDILVISNYCCRYIESDSLIFPFCHKKPIWNKQELTRISIWHYNLENERRAVYYLSNNQLLVNWVSHALHTYKDIFSTLWIGVSFCKVLWIFKDDFLEHSCLKPLRSNLVWARMSLSCFRNSAIEWFCAQAWFHVVFQNGYLSILRANFSMHQTNSGKSPKFVFTPTFIFCSPICSYNCGVVSL